MPKKSTGENGSKTKLQLGARELSNSNKHKPLIDVNHNNETLFQHHNGIRLNAKKVVIADNL